jgi:thiamine-monophosphate kinase
MTEEKLIAAIRGIVEELSRQGPGPRPIVLGIGDDAAAWQPSRSHLSVITTDALIDGVHFFGDRMTARTIGHRAMAANVSDIAAMGARPVLATIALGVAPGAEEAWLLELYQGMQGIAASHGVRIVGGDITRAPATMLSITVVGEVRRTHLRRRDAGRAKDVVAVTGKLGASRAGLELLRNSEINVAEDMRERALRAFETPEPRVREGRWLAASVNVHAMMDCSDGLSTDLGRLARASGCGALIESVPIDDAAQAVASAAGVDACDYALHGGEDFELIVTIKPRAFAHLAKRFEQRFGRALIPIGILEKDGGLRIREGAGARPIIAAGWDHLADTKK